MESIKFSFNEKIKLLFGCHRKKEKAEIYYQIFKKGESLVKSKLNMYTILESLMKIKASLTVLVENQCDSEIYMKI